MKRIAIAMLVAGWFGRGCVHVHEDGDARRGPPPHAPAHGYRHHQGSVDLRWDAHLGVYVVIGHPHHFFHDGRYYRRVGEHWERCGGWKKANWRTVDAAELPASLRKHYRGKKARREASRDD